MSDLTQKKCEACRADAPQATPEEIEEYRTQIPNWDILDNDGVKQLRRQYKFKNFAKALEFANKVGEIADQEDHHPSILVEYGKTTVTWYTHKINGLHVNDFIMAARSDQLA